MKTKISFLIVTGLASISLVAEGVSPQPDKPVPPDENLLQAMYDSSIHNPASLMVIGVLCVFAWLCDSLPFVDSKFVPHYTVIIGASIYWLFAVPSSVATNFPHPSAVFICNGIFCGFVAAVAHRQIVARLIAYVQNWNPLGGNSSSNKPTEPQMHNIGNP